MWLRFGIGVPLSSGGETRRVGSEGAVDELGEHCSCSSVIPRGFEIQGLGKGPLADGDFPDKIVISFLFVLWWGTPLTRVPGSRLKVYNTTTLADKYVRVSKVERAGGALQSILKSKELMVIEGGYKPSSDFLVPWLKVSPTIHRYKRAHAINSCGV